MTKKQIINYLKDFREQMCATCKPSNEECALPCNDYEALQGAEELIRGMDDNV